MYHKWYHIILPERHNGGGPLHVAAGGDADLGDVRRDDVLRAAGQELGRLGQGLRIHGRNNRAIARIITLD